MFPLLFSPQPARPRLFSAQLIPGTCCLLLAAAALVDAPLSAHAQQKAFAARVPKPESISDSVIKSKQADRPDAGLRRFLWVTRWDYHTPADVRKICRNAAS